MEQLTHKRRTFLTTLFFLILYAGCPILAQEKDGAFKISLQSDLLAYTTSGGWSAWVALQNRQNKFSLAYVNFPNRYSNDYEDTGIKDNDRFVRVQFARYFHPDKKMRNFFYGMNFQYHFREIIEDNNPSSLHVNGFKIAPIFGFEWHPWNKKENILQNLSLVLWTGPTFLFGEFRDELVLPNTGSIYPARDPIEASAGIMLSYTLFKK